MNTSPNNPNPPNAPDPLAVALSKLDPAPHGFDWNALMFAAGRESKARALAFWRAAAAVCAIAACGFAFAYLTKTPTTTEHIIYVERPVALPAPAAQVPEVTPVPEPLPPPPKPVSTPEAPVSEPLAWSFEPSEQGAAAKWFAVRNEVLTVGLSVLPDNGRKVSAPRGEK